MPRILDLALTAIELSAENRPEIYNERFTDYVTSKALTRYAKFNETFMLDVEIIDEVEAFLALEEYGRAENSDEDF